MLVLALGPVLIIMMAMAIAMKMAMAMTMTTSTTIMIMIRDARNSGANKQGERQANAWSSTT